MSVPPCWGEISQSLLHIQKRLPNWYSRHIFGAFCRKHSKRAPKIAGILVEEN
jgi:hypothetical protein